MTELRALVAGGAPPSPPAAAPRYASCAAAATLGTPRATPPALAPAARLTAGRLPAGAACGEVLAVLPTAEGPQAHALASGLAALALLRGEDGGLGGGQADGLSDAWLEEQQAHPLSRALRAAPRCELSVLLGISRALAGSDGQWRAPRRTADASARAAVPRRSAIAHASLDALRLLLAGRSRFGRWALSSAARCSGALSRALSADSPLPFRRFCTPLWRAGPAALPAGPVAV